MTTKYSNDHEWISINDGIGTVGITNHAQSQLGDIVFVELPTVGVTVEAGEEAGVVESVKAASDIITPVSGDILEVNDALEAEPSLANSDPTGNGWFFKIRIIDPSQLAELMNEPEYEKFITD